MVGLPTSGSRKEQGNVVITTDTSLQPSSITCWRLLTWVLAVWRAWNCHGKTWRRLWSILQSVAQPGIRYLIRSILYRWHIVALHTVVMWGVTFHFQKGHLGGFKCRCQWTILFYYIDVRKIVWFSCLGWHKLVEFHFAVVYLEFISLHPGIDFRNAGPERSGCFVHLKGLMIDEGQK